MKTIFTYGCCWLITAALFLTNAKAQCPPPGLPTPGNTCTEAVAICTDVGGYCDTLGLNNIIQTFPGCPSSVLNNDEWIKFIAASDSIAFRISPSDCQGLNGQFGMQGAIFDGCGGAALATQCNCTTSDFILAYGDFEPGATYLMVLDGCAGDVCAYEMEVIYGSADAQEAPFPPVGQILGNDTACTTTFSLYAVENSTYGHVYNWFTEPPGVAEIIPFPSDSLGILQWLSEGQFKVCVQATNSCFADTAIVCKDVLVSDIPKPDTVNVSLCQGQCFDLPDGQTVCEEGIYDVLIQDNGSCDTLRSFIVSVSEAPLTVLPEQVVCGGHFTLCNEVMDTSGAYLVNCQTPLGCDSLVSFELTLLNPIASIEEPGNLCLPGVLLDGSSSQFSEGNGISRQVSWEGPPGGLVTGSDSLTATAILPGTYCLTVYEEKNGQSCQHTDCVEVKTIPIGIPDSVQLCQGEYLPIDLSSDAYVSYLWSTGDTTSAIDVTSSGVYSVQAVDTAGCIHSATIEVIISNELYTGLPDTASYCENSFIEVQAASGFAHYLWDNGLEEPSASFNTPGWHYLVASTIGGCLIYDSLYLVELPVGEPGLPDHPICTTDYPFAVSASPGFDSYAWSNGDSTQTAEFDSAGTYQLTALQANGCFATGEVTLLDEPFNVADFPDTYSVCEQASPVTIELPSQYSYQWSTGSTSNSVTLEDLMYYGVTVTNDLGCVQSDSFFLTAKPTVELQDEFLVCPEEFPVNIMVDDIYASYYWSTKDMTAQIYVFKEGVYTVTVTDDYGCTASASTSVVSEPQSLVSLEAEELVLCEEEFPYELVAMGEWNVILWSTGEISPSIQVTQPGLYSVTVSNDAGCFDSATIAIFQSPPPMLQYPLDDTTVCVENLPITFDAGPGQAFYLWSTGDQTQAITLDEEDIQSPGFNLISVLFENAEGCRNTENFVLEVEVCNATAQAYLPGTFSIRPNPTNGEAHLVYKGLPSGNYELGIYQTEGKLLRQRKLSVVEEQGKIKLPVENLASGVYFIRLASQQGMAVLKLVIAGG